MGHYDMTTFVCDMTTFVCDMTTFDCDMITFVCGMIIFVCDTTTNVVTAPHIAVLEEQKPNVRFDWLVRN
jgi:hypothetical protein